MSFPLNESILDSSLARLEEARTWSPRVISKLETFIRTADDAALFRVNPVHYAAEKGMIESEAIDLFLHGAKLGLFEMEWNMVCACCGHVFQNLRDMGGLHAHFVCNICRMENTITLDDFIQVVFTIASPIRPLVYHSPDSLAAYDHLFHYQLAKGLDRYPLQIPNENYLYQATKAITYLEPGSELNLAWEATPGLVYIGNVIKGVVATLYVYTAASGAAPDIPQSYAIRFENDSTISVSPPLPAQRQEIPGPVDIKVFEFSQFAVVPSGPITIHVVNQSTGRVLLWAVNLPADVGQTWVAFQPFLSGKRLLNTQTFRTLFRTETIATDEGLGVRDITFLFTDLKGSTALYDQLGDLQAYHLVRQHFDALTQVITHHAGAVVKTIGDAVMATFISPLDAVHAALDMLGRIDEFNHGRPEPLILKIGLHRGHSIVVSLNDRLDYFGQTVNIASRVQGLAEAHEIYLSQDVYASPDVAKCLADYVIAPSQATVKGVSGALQVYKVKLRAGP
jgi:class 3 adenylate cyclase